jgi:hypothetical protein
VWKWDAPVLCFRSSECTWGSFYRQVRSVERMGPFSQVRPDEEVQKALWSTASRLGRPWSLLLRQLRVSALGRFRPVWRLGGAAGPLGATDPPLCRGMNRLRSGTLRMALEWRLWWLIGRRSGPIDQSDPNLIHSINLTFPWSISFIQVVLTGEEVNWTRGVPRGRCERT